MLRKIPIVAVPITACDISGALPYIFTENKGQEEFAAEFAHFIGKKHIFLINSGLAGFFIILSAIKKKLKKKEVILPAYTAASLIIAIQKAGLKPVLCDISLKDFNIDCGLSSNLISQDTLCLMGIHMFGIPAVCLKDFRAAFPDIFVIEDCAQSLGSKIEGKYAGGMGDVSFFSFNKGKNLPTYGGGCIATDNDILAKEIEAEMINIKGDGIYHRFLMIFKLLGLSLSANPMIYGCFYKFISLLKEKSYPQDFRVMKYMAFQAAIALALLKKQEDSNKKRFYNGMSIIKDLNDIQGVIVPEIKENLEPVFNRLPILFKDLNKRDEVEKRLWQAGIEASRMYLKPLHHIFELGYRKEEFPNACYLAQHLLTLPVHPLVRQEDLEKMIDIIHKTVNG